MSFIAKNVIGSDERLIGISPVHWIYVAIGMFWALVVLMIGAFVYQKGMPYLPMGMDQHFVWFGRDLGSRSGWMVAAFIMAAGGIFLMFFLQYLSTEIALTSKRVIRKTGLIAVEVQEIELSEIEAARVHHGWLGAILRYGSLHLDCRFVGDVYLPSIPRPYRFLTALHKMKAAPPAPAAEVIKGVQDLKS